MIFDSFNCKQ